MRHTLGRRAAPTALIAAALAAASGCGTPPPAAEAMRKLTAIYCGYAVEHKWAGPPGEAALKKYARAMHPAAYAEMGVERDKIDALWASPRDGRPLKVAYGVPVDGAFGPNPPAVAREQVGVGGRVLVAYASGRVEELPAAEAERLLP